MKHVSSSYLLLFIILLVAAVFRFYGLGWDSGYLLHPDERQIVLVATRLQWPSSLAEFFSADSPLNPKFFAYGSFPIYLLRALGAFAPASSLHVPLREDIFVSLGLLGRALSALFDLGTIVLIFLLGRRLYNNAVGLIAAAAVAVTVLHIQLSHFYAVDTVLTFLVVATMLFAARFAASGARRDAVAMGALFGLAVATKITAAPLVIPIVVAVFKAKGLEWRVKIPSELLSASRTLLADGGGVPASRGFWGEIRRPQPGRWVRLARYVLREWISRIWSERRVLAGIFGVSILVFVITQPYALLDPIRYFGQVGTEALLARGWLDFPYTRQYANTTPIVYPIVQSSVWGMGLVLGIAAWGGSLLFAWQWWRTRAWRDGFLLSWAFFYFLTGGAQYTKYLRYLLPLLPFLFLMMAVAFQRLFAGKSRAMRSLGYIAAAIVGVSALIYSATFSSIYANEHPWLQISNWIYQNIPGHTAIAEEHWDDTLPEPMQIGEQVHQSGDYSIKVLPMYDPDDPAKLQTVVDTLASSDYIVLASQRLYASIPRLPARYPMSSRYYQLLFSGQLGFDLVAFARNDPSFGSVILQNDTIGYAGLPVPRVLSAAPPGKFFWNWGHADESFVVYDHPMPLVFIKTRALSPAELRALLMP
jgi:hypothetical protein